MTTSISPHALSHLQDILFDIEEAQSEETAAHWHDKIFSDIRRLADFPLSCPVVPRECFHEVPPNPERLRQLICRPYRIVYEIVGSECRILSIRHGRMLVALGDTYWN